MTRILGVIPVVGRGPLVNGSIGSMTLLDRVLDVTSRVTSTVVVASAPDDAPLVRARPAVDHVTLPRDERLLRARLGEAVRVVVHDPLCPLVPLSFVQRMIEPESADVAVAVRPVVDTIKSTEQGMIAGTVDRDLLRVVSSPVVAPGAMLADLGDLTAALADLTLLVAGLRAVVDVEFVVAPSVSRRIEDTSGLRLLASVDAVSHRIRERN